MSSQTSIIKKNLQNQAFKIINSMNTDQLLHFINNNWKGEDYLTNIPKEIVFYIFRFLHMRDILFTLESSYKLIKYRNESYDGWWRDLLQKKLIKAPFKYKLNEFVSIKELYNISYYTLFLFWAFLNDCSKIDQRLSLHTHYGQYLGLLWKNQKLTKKYRPVLLSTKLSKLLNYKESVWLPKLVLQQKIKNYGKYHNLFEPPNKIKLNPKLRKLCNITNYRTTELTITQTMKRLEHKRHFSVYWWLIK